MKINVQIERLVLEGINVAPHQHPLLQAAVEGELTRLLSEGGINEGLTGGGSRPSMRGAPIQLGSDGKPDGIGHQIAVSVHKGISG